MKSKTLALRVAGTVFGIIALIHLLRLITGISVIIGGEPLPMWVNIVGLLATGFRCAWLWSLTVSTGSINQV